MATYLRVFRDILVGHAVVVSGMQSSDGASGLPVDILKEKDRIVRLSLALDSAHW